MSEGNMHTDQEWQQAVHAVESMTDAQILKECRKRGICDQDEEFTDWLCEALTEALYWENF